MKSNKKIGSDFEQLLCRKLSELGFWVHNFANRSNGQPVDIIAVKDGKPFIIDAKVCSNGRFQLKRIELNQLLACHKWERCGNGEGLFAFLIEDEVYMLSLRKLKTSGFRVSIPLSYIKEHGALIDDWIAAMSKNFYIKEQED